MEAFRKLYNCLGLEYTEHAQQVIESFSSPANPSETDAPVGSEEILRRNSASSISNWKRRLTSVEIEKIRCSVEDLSSSFYSAEDW